MKVEFTKGLTNGNWQSLRISLKERADNLNNETLTEEQKKVLHTVQTQPNLIVRLDEYQLLHEMAAQTKKLWKPGEILKVFFFGGQNKRTVKVLDYASIWSSYCSIKFQPTTNIDEAKIRVAFQPPGSWSYIGTDALGVPRNEPTINFGWLDSNLPDKDYKQVVLHEFGHSLGLIHEHQSPAVSISWNKPYVYQYFWLYYKWAKEDVERNIFHEFEKSTTRYSVLDKESIMGYFIPPQFTTDGQEFPKNYDLSAMDKQYIRALYPYIP